MATVCAFRGAATSGVNTPYRRSWPRFSFRAMPLSTYNTFEAEIIGGIFSNHGERDDAQQTTLELVVPGQNTQVIFHLNEKQAKEAYLEALVKAMRSGKLMVTVDKDTNTVPTIVVTDNLQSAAKPEASCRAEQLTLAY